MKIVLDCEPCGDTGIIIHVDSQNRDYAYRCRCPHGSRYEKFPLAPRQLELDGDDTDMNPPTRKDWQ